MRVDQAGMLLGLIAVAAVGVSACSGPDPHRESDGLCGNRFTPVGAEIARGDSRDAIQWSPDGSRILFGYAEDILGGDSMYQDVPDIYAVHVSGDPVHDVLDLPSLRHEDLTRYGGDNTMMFDLSADGSRIAYATCAVSKETVQVEGGDWQVDNSEIFVSNSDGGKKKRLTNNTYLDALPAWSPDGESLAFISDPDRSIAKSERAFLGNGYQWGTKYEATTRITINEVATGQSIEIGLPKGLAAAPIRLEWSPNGDRVAFVVLEGERHPWDLAVYTVGADGTGLTRISDAMSGPAWSPDGQSIAIAVPEGDDGRALYTFAADGSNPVKVDYDVSFAKIGFAGWSELSEEQSMGNLSWSPDGSAILIENLGGQRGVVPLRTGGAEAGMPGGSQTRNRALIAGAGGGSILASPPNDFYTRTYKSAWSPDGTQIATRTEIREIFELEITDRQGNSRVLLDWERNYR